MSNKLDKVADMLAQTLISAGIAIALAALGLGLLSSAKDPDSTEGAVKGLGYATGIAAVAAAFAIPKILQATD